MRLAAVRLPGEGVLARRGAAVSVPRRLYEVRVT